MKIQRKSCRFFYNKKDTKTRKQRKVALGQPRFHVLEGLQMAMNRNFPRKIHWQSKNINFVIGTLNQACMQNLSQIGESTGPTLVRHKRNVIMHILHTVL